MVTVLFGQLPCNCDGVHDGAARAVHKAIATGCLSTGLPGAKDIGPFKGVDGAE